MLIIWDEVYYIFCHWESSRGHHNASNMTAQGLLWVRYPMSRNGKNEQRVNPISKLHLCDIQWSIRGRHHCTPATFAAALEQQKLQMTVSSSHFAACERPHADHLSSLTPLPHLKRRRRTRFRQKSARSGIPPGWLGSEEDCKGLRCRKLPTDHPWKHNLIIQPARVVRRGSRALRSEVISKTSATGWNHARTRVSWLSLAWIKQPG